MDTSELTPVSPAAAAEYAANVEGLAAYLNASMRKKPQVMELIGHNELGVMYANHAHHARFIRALTMLNNYDLLVRTLPWVYRSYQAHGFSHDYFAQALPVWKKAVATMLSKEAAAEITPIYDWLISNHEEMVGLAGRVSGSALTPDPEWETPRAEFMAALLAGSSAQALGLARRIVTRPENLGLFFVRVVQPVMYEIGRLWELGRVSVTQEHIASAIVGRVMAALYAHKQPGEITRPRVVVTSAPGEFHELGAWMVSDLLEQAGWESIYLGADTPASDLIAEMKRIKPMILAVSLSVAINLERVVELIAGVRAEAGLEGLKIMAGGRVFNEVEGLWQSVGADGSATDAPTAVALAEGWLTHG